MEPGIGETMEAWRSRYCRRLFVGPEPSRAPPGLAFDRMRGVYRPRSAPGQQVRTRRLQTAEDSLMKLPIIISSVTGAAAAGHLNHSLTRVIKPHLIDRLIKPH